MEADAFAKKTRALCLYRTRVFKGTSLEQLYNRYLSLRSFLPFRPGCCSGICPGCYRSLSHPDRICRVKALNQKRNKISAVQIREVCNFPLRPHYFLNLRLLLADFAESLKPNAPSEVLGLSPFFTLSSKKSRKKKRKKDELIKEVRLQQSRIKKAKSDRSSLNDFLDLIS
ncbi:unnamed protein product [Taenia asiatica]|uniref:DUF1998 domain-containing protein n=1 Tax=Taenia asiatica TaxID=60517 RepID=A0A0R3WE07_TAEAS|nr:unnamed protein product [Taenia asiatica]